jgi:hypothetical protein
LLQTFSSGPIACSFPFSMPRAASRSAGSSRAICTRLWSIRLGPLSSFSDRVTICRILSRDTLSPRAIAS